MLARQHAHRPQLSLESALPVVRMRPAEPCAEHVRRQRQRTARQRQRSRARHAVIGDRTAAYGTGDLLGGEDRVLALAHTTRIRQDGGPRGRPPLVLGVGDDHRAVGELDLVARPPAERAGRGNDSGRPPVGVEQLVADLDLAHRGPAGRCGQRGVECEGLARARTPGNRDHLPRMQAVGDLVQADESGGNAGADATGVGDPLDLGQRAAQQRLDVHVVVAGTPFGDVVDLGLSAVDDVVDAAGDARRPGGRVVAHLHDAGAGRDQAAQHGLLGHDLGVIAGVRGRGHGLNQRDEVLGAADPHQLSGSGQFGRDGDGIGGLAARVQIEDRVVDELMRRAVEIGRAHYLDDVGDRVLAEQHSAERRLLSRDILGRGAVVRGVRRARFDSPRHLSGPP